MIPAFADEVAAVVVRRAAASPTSAALLPSLCASASASLPRASCALTAADLGDEEDETGAKAGAVSSFELESDAPAIA